MGRDLTSESESASEAGSGFSAILLADFNFDTGHVYVHTGAGTIIWDSKSFLGVGDFGSVTSVEETTELSAPTLEFALTGIPSEFISTSLTENIRNREVILYLGFIDSNGVIVDDPVILFEGRMDTMPISLGDNAVVRVLAESKLKDWARPRIQRYTNEGQQAKFPGDKGFEFVAQMVERTIPWGSAGTAF